MLLFVAPFLLTAHSFVVPYITHHSPSGLQLSVLFATGVFGPFHGGALDDDPLQELRESAEGLQAGCVFGSKTLGEGNHTFVMVGAVVLIVVGYRVDYRVDCSFSVP